MCRLCAVGCGTIVELDGARVVRIKGDPDDPWSQGYTCSKGRAGPSSTTIPAGSTCRSMRTATTASWCRRRGTRPSTTSPLASTAVVDEHGPAAVASYTGTGGPLDPSGYALAQGFFRALGSATMYSALSVDCSGKFLVPELIAGVQLQFAPDLPTTDLLLAIGINTVVSHGHGLMMPNPLGHLRDLRARGGRLVVVDPRRSETAHHADLHIAAAPGTDPALLAFLVRHVLEGGGADEAFLDACADPDGVARLRELVAPYTAERAAEICGVPIADLEALAAMVTAARRIGIETGTGVSMGRSANLTEWLVWALAAVTGSLDREGGCTFNPGFLRAIEDAPPGGRGDLGPRPASRPDLPRIVNGELPCAALADEIDGGAVHALIVRMGNPALGDPRPRSHRQRARQPRRARGDRGPPVADDGRRHPRAAGRRPLRAHRPGDRLPAGDAVPASGAGRRRAARRTAPAVVDLRRAEPAARPARCSAARAATPSCASGELDDDVIAASMAAHARRPYAEVLAAPYGIRDDSVAPGWLVPGRPAPAPRPRPARAGRRVHRASRRPWRPATAWCSSTAARPASTTRWPCARRRSPRSSSTPTTPPIRGCATATGPGSPPRRVRATCRSHVTDVIGRGVVSFPHAYRSANVNQLTSTADVDPLNGMPILSGFAVDVARVPATV